MDKVRKNKVIIKIRIGTSDMHFNSFIYRCDTYIWIITKDLENRIPTFERKSRKKILWIGQVCNKKLYKRKLIADKKIEREKTSALQT